MIQRQELLSQARTGDPKAQLALGCSYDFDQPVERRLATYWYRKAAEQGLAEAQNNLAEILRDERPTKQSVKEAVSWFKRAAELGDSAAQVSLGCSLFYGEGVKKNRKEALLWYRKAAKQGHSSGQLNIATCIEKGKACRKIGNVQSFGT